eukprot:8464184-Ditylum_brightwellii.AAC.1
MMQPDVLPDEKKTQIKEDKTIASESDSSDNENTEKAEADQYQNTVLQQQLHQEKESAISIIENCTNKGTHTEYTEKEWNKVLTPKKTSIHFVVNFMNIRDHQSHWLIK